MKCKEYKDHNFKPIKDGSNNMYQMYECKICLYRKFKLKNEFCKK